MSIRIFALGVAALALSAPAAAHASPDNNHASHSSATSHSGHGQASRPSRNTKRISPDRRYAGQVCPPGLAKKYPGCIPPGQWRKGHRVPQGWSSYYTPYNSLPRYYRTRHERNPSYRYMYQSGRVFVINPVTRVIVRVFVG